ncbi:MAG: hypothetical protein ACTSP6_12315, partial [Promethearchaeota archaeon]
RIKTPGKIYKKKAIRVFFAQSNNTTTTTPNKCNPNAFKVVLLQKIIIILYRLILYKFCS